MNLVEEISRQSNIWFVARILLVFLGRFTMIIRIKNTEMKAYENFKAFPERKYL